MMGPASLTRLAAAGLAGLAWLGLPGPAHPQGWIEPTDRAVRHLRVERLRSDVRITVDGARRLARVVVEEEFRNRSPVLLEGDYLYPIPAEAVFTDFSLFMGGQEIKGEILPAEKARGIYEEIVRRRKDPALIELVGHGVLRARVFPVAPGDTRRVILRYTQVLGRDGDLLRLRYPRIVGIRPGTERMERAPVAGRRLRHPFTLRVTLRDATRFGTPYSPTHTIEVRRRGEDELEIVHGGDGEARDFELFLPIRERFVGASVVTHSSGGEPGFFMLLVAPPVVGEEIAMPRDVTLVLDVSGSMSGKKIEQARSALQQILNGLHPADRFRLITFSSVVHSLRPGFTPASAENLRAAREYLALVRAQGSTNIMEALQEALEPDGQEERLSLVIFLTDGKPTIGETSPERIAEAADRLRDSERVFTFGVGYDVNTYLLDRMAERGRGSVHYVRPGEDLEAAVSSLTEKISFPALSDLRIVRSPVELEEFYPSPLPDLFYGQDLVVFGRYRGHGSGTLVLEGTRGGQAERFRYRVDFPAREPGNDFIPRLWASRKVGALTAQVRLHGADREVVEEIRQLGLRYGILTEYTSYLVEEPEVVWQGNPAEWAQIRARDLEMLPAEQSGAVAFRRAEQSSKLREAVMIQVPAPEDALRPDAARRAGMARHVNGRWFVLRDSTWTDAGVDPSLRVIEVEPFSPAYFELVQKLPALKAYFALGDRVVIAGEGVALKVAAGGVKSWEPDDLRSILKGFRKLASG